VIGEFAWRLLKSFNFDPKDLRGIGLQIQKLEPASAVAQAPTGQAILPFKTAQQAKPTKSASAASTAAAAVPPPRKEEPPPKQEYELPSFSQVDMSVFDALPPNIREELQNEYARRSTSPSVAAGPAPQAKSGTSAAPWGAPPLRRSTTPAGIFPPKNNAPGNANLKRITHQLAPRSAPSISPQKSALFALLQKAPPKPKMRISDAKLRELDIDPDVFVMLPKKVQDEQLVRARILKEKGVLPEPPSQRIIIKPKKPKLPPGIELWRARRRPKARYHTRPTLRQQGKDKKEKLVFTESSEVQDVLEKWVKAYRHWAPREKDVEYLSKFLLQSVDAKQAGVSGIETAVQVMKWWLILLRRYWPGSEYVEEDEWEREMDASQVDKVGKAWWDTFRALKEKMDVVAREKFGGCLSLR